MLRGVRWGVDDWDNMRFGVGVRARKVPLCFPQGGHAPLEGGKGQFTELGELPASLPGDNWECAIPKRVAFCLHHINIVPNMD